MRGWILRRLMQIGFLLICLGGVWLGVHMSSLASHPTLTQSQPSSPPPSVDPLTTQIHRQLEKAVATGSWDQASVLLDLLIQLYPSQRPELQQYRTRLLQLQRWQERLQQLRFEDDLPGDYPPSPVPSPFQDGSTWPLSLPLLEKPFRGSFLVTNVFDHNLPLGDQDQNRSFLTLWGDARVPNPADPCSKSNGHAGYDWQMPEGQILLAAAAGRVTLARLEPQSYCPLLDQDVQGQRVRIRHQLGELSFETLYTHLSRMDVREGQQVEAGDPIGLSGNSGCSTGAHLHFEVRQFRANQFISLDPYGWRGTQPDPWAEHPHGATSFFLWKVGQAPDLGQCGKPGRR
ncbi:MAG: M23 family metallopeptidase [Synechococcaceae cyanobacterium SM2_3_1]|nr:M23 family metallopeptidase [Synechococcaceae cyanobacterium SM2_3_1]